MSASDGQTIVAGRALLSDGAARVESALRGQWRMIERVCVRRSSAGDGYMVAILLDPCIVRARAEQQGLLDFSTAAAAESPRVLSSLDSCVERVNRTLPASETIVRWSILA